MGATMVAVIALGAIVWRYLWAWDFVPAWFGPRLGLVLPDVEATSHLFRALVLAALCLIVSAVVATRALYRGTAQRLIRAVGGLVGGIALVLLVALGVHVGANSRFPDAVNISLDGTGCHAMLVSHGESGGARGLWSLELDSGKLRQISRAGGTITEMAADAPRVAISWPVPGRYRDYAWIGDLATGELWRTQAQSWTADLSPDGRWVAAWDEGLVVYPVEGGRASAVRKLTEQAVAQVPLVAWGPHGSTIYVMIKSAQEEAGRLLHIDAFAETEPREVARIDPGWVNWRVPTHGRWASLVLSYNAPDAPNEMALLDMESGRLTFPGEWSINYRGWAADGQHAWARRELGDREYELGLLDLATGEPVRILRSEDFGGAMVGTTYTSPHSPDAVFFAYKRGHSRMEPVREWWWLPDPAATAPKRLPITDDDQVGGWNTHGEIILLRGRTVEALDPETGRRRVIRELPGREPEPGEDAA